MTNVKHNRGESRNMQARMFKDVAIGHGSILPGQPIGKHKIIKKPLCPTLRTIQVAGVLSQGVQSGKGGCSLLRGEGGMDFMKRLSPKALAKGSYSVWPGPCSLFCPDSVNET
jgi:hypothetical protein